MTKLNNKRPAKRPFSQDFSGPSKTDQSFKRSSDVNHIIAKYIQTGIDPMPGRAVQNFGFASSKTYSEVARELAEINSAFADLPSAERAKHRNEPAVWLDSLVSPTIEEEPKVALKSSQELSEDVSDVPPPEAPLPEKEAN